MLERESDQATKIARGTLFVSIFFFVVVSGQRLCDKMKNEKRVEFQPLIDTFQGRGLKNISYGYKWKSAGKIRKGDRAGK